MDELEAQLVASDLGVKMTERLIDYLKGEVKSGRNIERDDLVAVIKERLVEILNGTTARGINVKEIKRNLPSGVPVILILLGVNGVGKTTTAAKLAGKYKREGLKVMLAAADTFRAAAVEQLKSWGERVSVPVISGAPEAKPATVVFDALNAAKNEGADILIIDTAGRLHTKSNLMQELSGVNNLIEKQIPGAPHEKILVIDGSTGQNALSQAEQFNQAMPLSGLIVTKLDGTSKGGIVAAIKDTLGIPIRYIGVGESEEDLRAFDAEEFVNALISEDDEGDDVYTLDESESSAHSVVRRRRRQ